MKIPIISRIAGLPRRTRWIVISGIVLCGIELILALALSASWVKDAPRLLAFADWVKHFAPVVGNFDQAARYPSRYPEGLRVFLAITICLLPLKALWCGVLLSYDGDNSKAPLRHLVMTVFMAIFFLWSMLTFKGSRNSGSRGVTAFITSGMMSGGILLWLSWSILALGCASFLISGALLILWKKCVFVFHNLKRSQNG